LSTNKLKNLEREIAKVQTVHPINRNIVKELELQKEYERIHEQVEIFWQQRSRVRWAQLGDRNTKFFHTSATQRWRKNRILVILEE
jgi:hypothetical protein